MKLNTLIILSVIFIQSCKSVKTVQNKGTLINTESVLIAEGNLYGSGEEGIQKQNLVITSNDDWKALINQMNSVNNVSSSFT
ncbi:hypothetical protein [Winogradskyella bathintestinalis]|uniref:Uncharacterized protein n=1 Tax=Winogradskyella bathintestinalis TaxID=3035208 RepID=A0ABT7ZSK4_9FLAO|nr:hypothetical protein [Winogradskyella bathintestinalis]MDN3491936.1 hypothetical protein [Winogradskyella bathintestinalis]